MMEIITAVSGNVMELTKRQEINLIGANCLLLT